MIAHFHQILILLVQQYIAMEYTVQLTVAIFLTLVYCHIDNILHIKSYMYCKIKTLLKMSQFFLIFFFIEFLIKFYWRACTKAGKWAVMYMCPMAVCEISGRPIDNAYVKLSWSMSNIQNFVYNVQWGPCKIDIGLWYHKM